MRPKSFRKIAISNLSNSIHSIRGYGREGWCDLDRGGPGRPFCKTRGGRSRGERVPPLPLDDCEGSLFPEGRPECPENWTEKVAGDGGMAIDARAEAEGSLRSASAKLASKGSGRDKPHTAWEARQACGFPGSSSAAPGDPCYGYVKEPLRMLLAPSAQIVAKGAPHSAGVDLVSRSETTRELGRALLNCSKGIIRKSHVERRSAGAHPSPDSNILQVSGE